MTKCVRQHKIVKGGKLQKSESSLICVTMRWQHKTIPYRIGRRSGQQGPRLPPYTRHGGVKYVTGAPSKIRGRDITIGTWNTRTLRAAGKLQELTHEMDRYRWNILGFREMRWKNFGKKLRKDKRFSSMEKRINMSMALDFLLTKTLRTLSWDAAQSPAGSSPSTWRQSLSTSQ